MENRIELLNKTIEEQHIQIANYKSKLKDVVLAYKDLTQEKLALEASIAVLKNIGPQFVFNSDEKEGLEANETDRTPTEKTCQGEISEDGAGSEGTDGGAASSDGKKKELGSIQKLKEQLDVLTSSLLTVTQQKTKLEGRCLAERKQYKQELDKKNTESQNLTDKIIKIEAENSELRNKLRNQQQEHDKQQNDCALIIKELQSLLNSERMISGQLYSQIEDLKMEIDEKKKAVSAHVASLANREVLLKQDLQVTKESLKDALLKLSQPPPRIAILEQQLVEANGFEEKLRKVEGMKLEEAEKKVAEISEITEARICGLEEKILEVSEMLGNAEKSKLSDQVIIQKLKERNIELDQENKTLFALSRSNERKDLEDFNSQETITKLKTKISDLVSNGHDLSCLYDVITCGEDLHRNCKVQQGQVREEFERYKLRAQSVLKNKSNKDSVNDPEVVQIKRQVSELKEKILHLRNDIKQNELELKSKDESHSKVVSGLVEKHKTEVNQSNMEWHQQISNLEAEMRKQRERTISMLAEKEQEISELKFYTSSVAGHRSPGWTNEKLLSKNDTIFSHRTAYQSSPLVPDDNGIGASSGLVEGDDESVKRDSSDAIKHLLSRRSDVTMLAKDTSNLLHFAQEKARLEMDLALMRKQKQAAEASGREMQYLLALKDDEHKLEVNALEESVKKVERDIGRGSANLEYLKNVVFQYMICKETSSGQRMFNAISTILQFSPNEKQIVQARKGWRL